MKKIIVGISMVAAIAGFVFAAGNVVPPSSGGASLGSSTLQWLAGYFTSIYTTNITVYGTLTAPVGSIGAPSVSGTVTGLTVVTGTFTGGTSANATNTGTTVAAEVKIDSKYAVVGGDATTPLMVQKGTFTNGQATVTFAVPYPDGGGTPVVTANWVEDGSALEGSNCTIFVTGIASNQFVPKCAHPVGLTLTNAGYIVIGTRP